MLAMNAPNGSNDPANAILSLMEESKDWPPTWLDVYDYSTTSPFSLYSILGLSTIEYECFLSNLGIKKGSRGYRDRIQDLFGSDRFGTNRLNGQPQTYWVLLGDRTREHGFPQDQVSAQSELPINDVELARFRSSVHPALFPTVAAQEERQPPLQQPPPKRLKTDAHLQCSQITSGGSPNSVEETGRAKKETNRYLLR
jgi:hypothetical protein